MMRCLQNLEKVGQLALDAVEDALIVSTLSSKVEESETELEVRGFFCEITENVEEETK